VTTSSELERTVACGGFAAEVYLLKNGYAEKGPDDERDINRIVFHNATNDREDFWQRERGSEFTDAEDREFMNNAVGVRWRRRRCPNLQPLPFGNAGTRARALRREEGRRQASEGTTADRDIPLRLWLCKCLLLACRWPSLSVERELSTRSGPSQAAAS
jgi:hypothetical protein